MGPNFLSSIVSCPYLRDAYALLIETNGLVPIATMGSVLDNIIGVLNSGMSLNLSKLRCWRNGFQLFYSLKTDEIDKFTQHKV